MYSLDTSLLLDLLSSLSIPVDEGYNSIIRPYSSTISIACLRHTQSRYVCVRPIADHIRLMVCPTWIFRGKSIQHCW